MNESNKSNTNVSFRVLQRNGVYLYVCVSMYKYVYLCINMHVCVSIHIRSYTFFGDLLEGIDLHGVAVI